MNDNTQERSGENPETQEYIPSAGGQMMGPPLSEQHFSAPPPMAGFVVNQPGHHQPGHHQANQYPMGHRQTSYHQTSQQQADQSQHAQNPYQFGNPTYCLNDDSAPNTATADGDVSGHFHMLGRMNNGLESNGEGRGQQGGLMRGNLDLINMTMPHEHQPQSRRQPPTHSVNGHTEASGNAHGHDESVSFPNAVNSQQDTRVALTGARNIEVAIDPILLLLQVSLDRQNSTITTTTSIPPPVTIAGDSPSSRSPHTTKTAASQTVDAMERHCTIFVDVTKDGPPGELDARTAFIKIAKQALAEALKDHGHFDGEAMDATLNTLATGFVRSLVNGHHHVNIVGTIGATSSSGSNAGEEKEEGRPDNNVGTDDQDESDADSDADSDIEQGLEANSPIDPTGPQPADESDAADVDDELEERLAAARDDDVAWLRLFRKTTRSDLGTPFDRQDVSEENWAILMEVYCSYQIPIVNGRRRSKIESVAEVYRDDRVWGRRDLRASAGQWEGQLYNRKLGPQKDYDNMVRAYEAREFPKYPERYDRPYLRRAREAKGAAKTGSTSVATANESSEEDDEECEEDDEEDQSDDEEDEDEEMDDA